VGTVYRPSKTLCLAAFVALLGCTHHPARLAPAGAPPAPAVEAAAPAVDPAYDVPGPVPEAKVELKAVESGFETWRVTLPAKARPGDLPSALEPIHMTWYRPLGGSRPAPAPRERRPAVVVSPILGNTNSFVSGFAEAFAHAGWHGLIVKRPKIEYDATRPMSQIEDRLRIAVERQVQALDWLLTREDVDPSRIGSFGISAGGIQNAMVAGVDTRYVAHVFGLAGGPLVDVFQRTDEDDLRGLVKKVEETEGISGDALTERLREVIRTDPVLLAPRVPPEKVLLVISRFDRTVPTDCGECLWRALGRPELVRLPLGHYTAVVALPFVETKTVSFLRSRFEAVVLGRVETTRRPR
jgi:hypothetical protein